MVILRVLCSRAKKRRPRRLASSSAAVGMTPGPSEVGLVQPGRILHSARKHHYHAMPQHSSEGHAAKRMYLLKTMGSSRQAFRQPGLQGIRSTWCTFSFAVLLVASSEAAAREKKTKDSEPMSADHTNSYHLIS